MFFMGFIFGVGAVLIGRFYALHDYWNPHYLFGNNFPVEDFLYGLFFGGIVSSVSDYFFRPTGYKTEKPHLVYAVIGLFITIGAFYLLVDVFNFNSIWAHILPPFLVGLVILFRYGYLWKYMFLSAFVSLVITFVLFQALLFIDPLAIQKIWILENLTGLMFWRIPFEEYVFAASLGFGASFFYEILTGKIPKL